MPANILIIEDSEPLAMMYQSYLIPTGHHVQLAYTGKAAQQALSQHKFDVIMLDVMLPDINGMDLLASLPKEGRPQVVVLTGHASQELAVQAIRLGATDFLEKPVEADRFRVTVNNALKIKSLTDTVVDLQNTYQPKQFYDLVGSSKPMQAVYQVIENAASSKATVFVMGESGTGKELCARALHHASPRSSHNFIALNCAAIPKDLIESEIFGHVKGAFTGATASREGAAGLAHKGTLFLDEICEMDLNLQSKLLRFIQTGTFNKVGSEKLEQVDVRFVCATNRDPLAEVRAGRFREDLYYRLHVIPIYLPPLRERGKDIIEIAQFLFSKIAKEEHKSYTGLSQESERKLLKHTWPGNVRELENLVRNTMVMSQGGLIEPTMLNLPEYAGAPHHSGFSGHVASEPSTQNNAYVLSGVEQVKPLWLMEKEYIEQVIELCEDNISKAAVLLDVSPSTIYRKIKSWNDMLLSS
jgi:two-component system repressor protein LuxO